jgi:hypothetical protein
VKSVPVPLIPDNIDPVPLIPDHIDPAVPLIPETIDPVPLIPENIDPVPLILDNIDPAPLILDNIDPVPLIPNNIDPVSVPTTRVESASIPLASENIQTRVTNLDQVPLATTRVENSNVPLVSDTEDSDTEDSDTEDSATGAQIPPKTRHRTRLATASIPRKYYRHALNSLLISEFKRDFSQANTVIDEVTGAALEYEDLLANENTRVIWSHSSANEFGRLANGVGTRMPTGTNTIVFISKSDVPKGRFATYAKFVCTIRPQKQEVHRTRLTIGGNLINYPGDISTPNADMTLAKILINSTLSTPNAKWLGADLKDFYLNTPMDRYEYMRIPLRLIPQEIIDQYNLLAKVAADGYVYMEIRKGMYGLARSLMIN